MNVRDWLTHLDRPHYVIAGAIVLVVAWCMAMVADVYTAMVAYTRGDGLR